MSWFATHVGTQVAKQEQADLHRRAEIERIAVATADLDSNQHADRRITERMVLPFAGPVRISGKQN